MTYHFSLFNNLTLWYTQNKRSLPWRDSNDPYIIWISEIIFQQTRIDQGLPFFQRFVDKFPNVYSLASSKEQEIFSVWQGLGYYSRAKNILLTARIIVNQYNGVFPNSYDQIVNLKGIGPYTAAAIASIAFNSPTPAIDGNVKRVGARLFLIKENIFSSAFHKQLFPILQRNIGSFDPSTFNQAVMELGALICLPQNPKCSQCPVEEFCLAAKTNQQDGLPVSDKKSIKKNWFIDFFVIEKNNSIFLTRRTNEKIWNNLAEFPNVSSDHPLSMSEWNEMELFKLWIGPLKEECIVLIDEANHQLSHRNIKARFWKIHLPIKNPPNWELINIELDVLPPVHVLIRNFFIKHYPNFHDKSKANG